MVKYLEYVKINSVNPLYLITNKRNGYTENNSGNKYLMQVSTNESKNTIKKYEERCCKIKDFIRSETNN